MEENVKIIPKPPSFDGVNYANSPFATSLISSTPVCMSSSEGKRSGSRALRPQKPKAPEVSKVAIPITPERGTVKCKRKSSEGNNPDVWMRLKQRVKYLIAKVRQEQNFLDAYLGQGWKGQSSEKIRPEKELQRAENQIVRYKLEIRNLVQELDTLARDGCIDDSVFDSEGNIFSEDIFCAKCKSHEPLPDNDIILCDGACNRGFHQLCLEPPLKTEDIPPGDEPWFCPACKCKFSCLDFLNSYFGTEYRVEESWKQIFAEVVIAEESDGQCSSPQIDWPSEDSEDDDYVPKEESLKIGKESSNIGLDASLGTSSENDSSSDSDASIFDEFAEEKKSEREFCSNVKEDLSENEDQTGLGRGKRLRKELDYKKLFDETFKRAASAANEIGENLAKRIDCDVDDSDSDDYDPQQDALHTKASDENGDSDSDSTDGDSEVSFFDEFAEKKKSKRAKIARVENHRGTYDGVRMPARQRPQRKVNLKNLDAAIVTMGAQIDFPSEDSEDNDYNPDEEKASDQAECKGDAYTSDDSSTDGDSQVSFFDEFAENKRNRKKKGSAISQVLDIGNCILVDVDDDVPLVEGNRNMNDVDSTKLHHELYGKSMPDNKVNEDEAWGLRKNADKEKQDEGPFDNNASQLRVKQETSPGDQTGEEVNDELGTPTKTSQPKKKVTRLSPQTVEKLREVFDGNQLPSKSCKEDLSRKLSISYEKVNIWFKNARRRAVSRTQKEPVQNDGTMVEPSQIIFSSMKVELPSKPEDSNWMNCSKTVDGEMGLVDMKKGGKLEGEEDGIAFDTI